MSSGVLLKQLAGSPYTQNFNSLATVGASNTSVPAEWGYFEVGGNLTYEAGNGTNPAGNTYSFGTTGDSDRAFGEVTSNTFQSIIGAGFINDSHRHITTIIISYTGEQWRQGDTGGTPDKLDFQISTNATDLSNGTWTDVDALDFVTPNTTSASGALNGNAAGNNTVISSIAISVDIAHGGSFLIRWVPTNIAGVDDGLAIDNFTLATAGPAVPRESDFDGNGLSDILWRRDNGAASIWDNGNINNAHIISNAGAIGNDWHISGRGDFDGNGQSDILWRNDDGSVSIWNNGQSGGAHTVSGAGVVANSWHISGTGDFDGNGHHDILWRNDNGAVSIWDNGAIADAHIIAAAGVVSNNWHISGTGDFDGNGATDILWRNDNGAASIWDNGEIAAAHIISNAGEVPNAWHISGAGDFNGDGTSDILWRHDNGAVSVWDSGQIANAHIIAAAGVVPNSWHIAGTGDFNGDGVGDISWRNDNGAVSIWDNGAIAGAHIIAAAGVVPNDWHIV